MSWALMPVGHENTYKQQVPPNLQTLRATFTRMELLGAWHTKPRSTSSPFRRFVARSCEIASTTRPCCYLHTVTAF